MPQTKAKQEPVRQSVHVDCPIDDAFRLFTESFAQWWPLTSYSISGDEAETCAIEPWVGGRIFERTRSGEEQEWGSVTEWDPPGHLTFSWDPGGTGDSAQTVSVEFNVDADGTKVTLIHAGWEAPGIAVCALQSGAPEIWSTLLEQAFRKFASEMLLPV